MPFRKIVLSAVCTLILPLTPRAQGATIPGAPDVTTAADSIVTFNEIMYHPAGDESKLEWLEIYNQMSVNIDLSHWRLEGAVDFLFPTNIVLTTNSYLVIAADPEGLKAATGLTNVIGPLQKRLSNSGEKLRLRNHSGRIMDEMEYSDEDPWAVGADGSGASLAKKDRFYASSPAANWVASSRVGGTPGAINFPLTGGNVVPQNQTLIAATTTGKVLVPADGTLGNTWVTRTFDDITWGSGTASLGYDTSTNVAVGIPVRAYSFDGSTADISGHNVPGENQGATFANETALPIGRGQSITFDGVSGQVRIPDPVQPSAYTISAWVYVDMVRPSSLIVRTDGSGPRTSWSHQLRINGGGFFEHYLYDGAGRTVAATNKIEAGAWYHVAGTAVNNSAMKIYVNGVASGPSVVINTMWTAGDQWRLGTDSGGGANFFKGKLDEIGIWDFALTPENIASLAAGTLPMQMAGLSGTFGTDVKTRLFQKGTSLYARYPFNVDGGITYDQLILSIKYADGFVAFLNGVEVLRRNAPGTLLFDSAATADRSIAEVFQPLIVDLTSFASQIVPGRNVLAVQGLNGSASDPNFLLSLDLTGHRGASDLIERELSLNEIEAAGTTNFFVEIINRGKSSLALTGCSIVSSVGGKYDFPATTLDPNALLAITGQELNFRPANGDKLFLMGPGGTFLDAAEVRNRLRGKLLEQPTGPWLYPFKPTPGAANEIKLRAEIVINEIMYRHPPLYRTATQPFTEVDEEWVELHNRSTETMNLSGWQLDGEISFTFPEGTVLAPDDYLVVTENKDALAAKYPGIRIYGNFNGKLSSRSSTIVLKDEASNPANAVTFYNSFPWPSYPNGGGSSLELRDPHADNSVPESWSASDESGRGKWQHVTIRRKAITPVYTPGLFNFHEFRMGLLNEGEALVDNITFTELSTNNPPRQLLQNTNFSNGPERWRLLGTHSHSFVEADKDKPGNNVLHLVATDGMSYMDNRVETTLKAGTAVTPVVAGREYEISFDAKWIAGSPQLHTEIYYNKITVTTILDMPGEHGTPGRRNSTYLTNAGPTFTGLEHRPVVPRSTESPEVRIRANDPDGISGIKLFYSVNGGSWQTRPMTLDAGSADLFVAAIPPQINSAVIQFYVEGTDAKGATAMYPARGPASRALIKIDSPRTSAVRQIFRDILTTADASLLHATTNLMSDDLIGCTIIHNENEVFYDARIRLHGSMFSRVSPDSTGMTFKFPADHLLRGSRESVIVRRRGLVETFIKHMQNQAGGFPSMYDDLVQFVSHRTDNQGAARMLLSNYDDTYIDSQFEGRNDGTVFKLEGIREFQAALPNTPEGYKLPMPIGWIASYDIANLGDDPEQYRWGIMIQSKQPRDDYSKVVALGKAFSLSGNALYEATKNLVNVDSWARQFALQTLVGITDIYGVENPHNFAFYVPGDGSGIVSLPNDWEFAFQAGTPGSLYGGQNVYKMLRLPQYRRIYQGHMLDMMNNVTSPAQTTNWARYYSTASGESYTAYPNYMNSRNTVFKRLLPAAFPFEITSNGGAEMTVPAGFVTLEGKAWIDVHDIFVEGQSKGLPITWLDDQRWQTQVPLQLGTNALVLVGKDFRGQETGRDTINVLATLADFPEKAYLRVSEIMYHPSGPNPAESAKGFGNADEFEYIELVNLNSNVSLSLLGVKFTAGITFDFTTSTVTNLPPAGRVVLVKNRAAFEMRYPGVAIAGEYAGSLNNAGELIRLEDALRGVIQEFTYGDSTGWPAGADGEGSSLETLGTDPDPNKPESWRPSILGGTPGSTAVKKVAFQSAIYNGQQVLFRFEANADQGYSIYTRSNLLTGTWTLIKAIAPKAADRVEEVAEIPSEAQRYYLLSSP